MRNRETIEREMYRAREDLEESLAELKNVVQSKVDVKARARVAIERGKDKAAQVFERGRERAHELAERGKDRAHLLAAKSKEGATDLYWKSRDTVQERPVLVGSIVGGLIATGVLIYVGRQKNWW